MNYQVNSSVILCTRNRPDDLLKCLESLKNQTDQASELIIIDSSTNPLTTSAIFNEYFCATQFPRTKLIYQHTQPGLTYQRNIGISLAQGDIIYFFDDDVVLKPDYLETMNYTFKKSPGYAGGMGSVINIDPYKPTPYRLFRKLFLLPRDYENGTFTSSGMPKHSYGIKNFQEVEILGGCCMAFRGWALNSVRFDENLKRYGYMEDCDISRRVSLRHKLFYQPSAQLEHYNSPLSRDHTEDNRAMFVANYSYLFFKNFYPKKRMLIFAYFWSITGLLLESILLQRCTRSFKGLLRGLVFTVKKRAKTPWY